MLSPRRTSESPSKRPRLAESPESSESGFLDERVLVSVFECLNWDIQSLCRAAAVNHKLRAVAKRLLWRELCTHHAPRMVSALAKLLFFCGGCESTRHFELSRPSPGHFVRPSRFSKTSGRSFLTKKCRGDVLYVSDPCEHEAAGERDLIGIYRGVFRGFMKSMTRACLISRRVEFESGVLCPYCGARVWSMTAARLIPQRNAVRRLGSSDDGTVEYFVCLNGHLHGACWLVPLSSDDDDDDSFDCDRRDNSSCKKFKNY